MLEQGIKELYDKMYNEQDKEGKRWLTIRRKLFLTCDRELLAMACSALIMGSKHMCNAKELK